MSSDKEKPERPKSKMGGFSSVFKTLGRGGSKKDKNAPQLSTGPVHGAVLGKPVSSFSDVPPLARRCLDFLETDAVFRLDSFSLAAPSITEVQRVVKTFEDSDPEMVSLSNESPDTVCGVLRKWLRSLPEPLFSYEQYDAWITLQQNAATIDDLPGEIQNIMFTLHPTHYLVLQRVLRFLHRLSLYGSVNRLSSTVIGYNWQSCLIWSQASTAGLDAAKMGQDATLTGALIACLIENYPKLFLEDSTWVPPDDVHATTGGSHVVVSAVPHHQLTNLSQSNSSTTGTLIAGTTPPVSTGIIASSSSISRSEDDEHSTESPSNTTSTPPQPISAHTFSSAATSPGLSSSLPSSLQQNSSPLHIHQHHPSPSGNGSPTATPPASFQTIPPPLIIPNTTTGVPNGSNSMPVTPITPLVAPGQTQPLARSFAGQPALPNSNSFRHSQGVASGSPELSVGPASPRHSVGPTMSASANTTSNTTVPAAGRTKQPVLVNGYTQATTLCDFSDMTDGMLQFFKNEHIYITNKHDDGWWEGWKRGRRGFFPANYVVEIAL